MTPGGGAVVRHGPAAVHPYMSSGGEEEEPDHHTA